MLSSCQLDSCSSGFGTGGQVLRTSEKYGTEGTYAADGLGARGIGHGEVTGQLQSADSSELKSFQGQLVAYCPSRDEGNAKTGLNCTQQAFVRVKFHADAKIFHL